MCTALPPVAHACASKISHFLGQNDILGGGQQDEQELAFSFLAAIPSRAAKKTNVLVSPAHSAFRCQQAASDRTVRSKR
jgi:hypothetical protein